MKAILASLALLLAAAAVPSVSLAASPKTLVFTGALNDSAGKPIGGVFSLRFGLHQRIDDPKLIWSEDLYVAVEKGSYQVELGKERPIPQTLPLATLFLSVQVDGVEVQRVPVAENMISGVAKEQASAAASSPAGQCGQCQIATKAVDSDKLGGMTFAQLLETLAKRQIALGTSLHMTDSVGKKEGEVFFLTCPPGYVVTGIKGSATDSIKSAQLVCSPLENK